MMGFSAKIAKTVFKFAVAAGLVAALVFAVDWRSSWEVARSIDTPVFAGYIAILVLGIAISARKWKVLTDFLGFSFSFRRHFFWYLAGTFVNNFLPSIVGGDTYRAIALGKMNESRASAAASVLLDRYTGLVSMAGLAVVFGAIQFTEVLANPLWLLLFLGALAGVVAQHFFLPGRKWSLFGLVFRLFPKKGERMRAAMERFRDRGIVRMSFLWGALFSFVGVGIANYILFRALGSPIGLFEFLSVIFFINIIAALPVSINNIGVKEWAYYVFFGFLGIAPEVSVTAAIVSRLSQSGLSVFGIPTFFAKNRDSGTIDT